MAENLSTDLGLRLIKVNAQLINAVLETCKHNAGRTQDDQWADVYAACREVTRTREELHDWNTRGRFELSPAPVMAGMPEVDAPEVAALARVLCAADVICPAHIHDARVALAWTRHLPADEAVPGE